ncbi:hypothetical protein [Actinomadura rudentiformis]|uniref:Uncharacterized protein n=1 Tax=Actinomadura rudentiformis TaxID=359158 RepID=A0A6H9Z1K8_9ACTN|nr:hypothetical protein [Actinomadura rudentiformis]KAB2347974.1 hypothetical protein F8566_19045 [Actinomadura rudentiformis]
MTGKQRHPGLAQLVDTTFTQSRNRTKDCVQPDNGGAKDLLKELPTAIAELDEFKKRTAEVTAQVCAPESISVDPT